MDSAWDTLLFFETEPTARKYLARCYQNEKQENPDRLAFQQSTRFLYLWRQARLLYSTAAKADLSIQPLLLFYGCTCLLKGMLITRDPAYPQNSRVLQHGVTTRKVKRSPYVLIEDEIRPQKEGFFSHLAQRFHLTPLQDRYLVHDLFISLAEMSDIYAHFTDQHPHWVPLELSSVTPGKGASFAAVPCYHIIFPETAEGPLAYSSDTFIQYVRRFAPDAVSFEMMDQEIGRGKKMVLPQFALSQLEQHPLFYHRDHKLFFWNGSTEFLPLPQWASHYLLLFLLGMLCRYETEWWGEITMSHSMAERYVIERFLAHHMSTFPSLIVQQIPSLHFHS